MSLAKDSRALPAQTFRITPVRHLSRLHTTHWESRLCWPMFTGTTHQEDLTCFHGQLGFCPVLMAKLYRIPQIYYVRSTCLGSLDELWVLKLLLQGVGYTSTLELQCFWCCLKEWDRPTWPLALQERRRNVFFDCLVAYLFVSVRSQVMKAQPILRAWCVL